MRIFGARSEGVAERRVYLSIVFAVFGKDVKMRGVIAHRMDDLYPPKQSTRICAAVA